MIGKLNPLILKVIIDRQGLTKAFIGGSVVKNPPANAGGAGDMGLIPGWEGSPGVGNGNPLQYSCLENPMHKEPGGLQSLRLQRVRHDGVTTLSLFFPPLLIF